MAPEFYEHEVLLTYKKKDEKLFLQRGTTLEPLQERDAVAENRKNDNEPGRFQLELVPTVHAQNGTDFKTMSERLESNDVIVRIQARSDLAALGSNALTYIQSVLSDPGSSPRLRLGVIVALNNVPNSKFSLNESAECAIIQASVSAETTLKEQAEKYLLAHREVSSRAACGKRTQPVASPQQHSYLESLFDTAARGARQESVRELFSRSSQNLESDPHLSLNLVLYALTARSPVHLSLSSSEKRALQNLLWENGWLRTYTIADRKDDLSSVDVSPDGKTLVTIHADRKVRIWDISSGQLLHILEGHKGTIVGAAFSDDGSMIVTWSRNDEVKLWKTATAIEVPFRLQGVSPNGLTRVMFSPDGLSLAILDDQGKVAVWSVSAGVFLYSVKAVSDQPMIAFTYSRDGSLLVTANRGGEIDFWDSRSGRQKHSSHEFNVPVYYLVFSPDGKELYAAGGNEESPEFRVINALTYQGKRVFPGGPKNLATGGPVFDYEGRLCFFGLSSAEFRIWDKGSGAEVLMLHGHKEWRSHFAISTDGKTLVAWNKTSVRVVPIAIEELVNEARSHRRIMSAPECREYFHASECPELNQP